MDLDAFFNDNPDWRPYADLVAIPPTPKELREEFPDISPEAEARCLEFTWENGGFVSRGAIYARVRRESQGARKAAESWATMLSLQAPPGIKTTDTFWAGRKNFHQTHGEEYANTIKAKLARRGVNLKPGDEYMPELARFQGDPEAVIPFGNARGYIKSLCERRGWAVEGPCSVEAREPDSDPYENCPPMAEHLIAEKGRMLRQKHPELRKLKRPELRQAVLDKFGPSK